MQNFFAGCLTPADVKSRYRELAKKHHPDKPTGNAGLFKALAAQYETLKPKKPYIWSEMERTAEITRLVSVQRKKNLKKIFVYFAYQTKLLEEGQKLTRFDLEFIAGALDYKSGWIEFKCQENNID